MIRVDRRDGQVPHPRMTPQEMKQPAELLQSVFSGIKSIELDDVERLAQLLRDAPEIGSIEVRGCSTTKVVITRTGSGGRRS